MQINDMAIVGGGIAGLATAILFARKGCVITVYEQAACPGPVGAGFLLQPPGQRVLEKLGVLDEVMKCAVPITGLCSQNAKGQKILDLDYRKLAGNQHGLGVQRSTIYDALFQQAKTDANIHFKWAAKVVALEQDDKGVAVKYGEKVAVHDWAILAAGSSSTLASFKGRVCKPYDWGCMWSTIRLPTEMASDILHQRCHQASTMMGILPVLQHDQGIEAALYWSAKVVDMQAMNEAAFEPQKQRMMDFWPEAAASIAPLAFSDFALAVYRDIWTPTPFKGRITAIGDASHATSPQLGQGCTMALLDAYSLSQQLGELNNFPQNEAEFEQRLQHWWKARKHQLKYVRQLSRFLTPLYQSDRTLYGVFRDRLVAPTGKLPLFDRLQLRTLASDIGLGDILNQ